MIRVWAPSKKSVDLVLGEFSEPMVRTEDGWWESNRQLKHGMDYQFVVEGERLPDPRSPWLDHLVDLGITHVEIMPVAEFLGDHGWGYDGVYMYAPHHAYGGPDGLKQFVNACHERGLAVLLDVVYNH
jgi:1,4-alpha-glucan branching enzyme